MSPSPHLLPINTLRFLAIDAVEKARSGHPGMPMGAAPMAYALWTGHLRFDPKTPDWPNRDRFVLSAGHGSMLLYGLLHLSGFDLSLEELQQFRQWESRTAGHPECFLTPGVETTTGPLGQGLAAAVGMAIAERHLAATFNRPGFDLVDHHTYVIAGDGDLMEGVCSEAASLAGHLGLGRLIVLYDDNRITIEGGTELAFSEDAVQRFAAYGWQTLEVEGGNDVDALNTALRAAREDNERPSFIRVRTHIGYGSPAKQDSAGAHGAPLGPAEVRATKDNLGWPQEPAFLVPDGARAPFARAATAGHDAHRQWQELLAAYRKSHPDLADEWDRRTSGRLPANWSDTLPEFEADAGGMATRSAGGKVLNALATVLPELIGGSADLGPSTKTVLDGAGSLAPGDFAGRNLHFGVREHGMAAVMNGMANYGGLLPYGSTFFVFSDYLRPSLRLAALAQLQTVHVFTHDSIFVGEDGPTHQPVEHLPSLRAMPNLAVIRPADANETAEAWRVAVERRDGPTALLLTRQNVPTLDRGKVAPASGLQRGGYVLQEGCRGADDLDLILIASGSEVHLALEAATTLEEEGRSVRVVSLPCWELFEAQTGAYRDQVLPPAVTRRLAVEAAQPFGWERYVGLAGRVIGMDEFGASAPADILAAQFGFTTANVIAVARQML